MLICFISPWAAAYFCLGVFSAPRRLRLPTRPAGSSALGWALQEGPTQSLSKAGQPWPTRWQLFSITLDQNPVSHIPWDEGFFGFHVDGRSRSAVHLFGNRAWCVRMNKLLREHLITPCKFGEPCAGLEGVCGWLLPPGHGKRPRSCPRLLPPSPGASVFCALSCYTEKNKDESYFVKDENIWTFLPHPVGSVSLFWYHGLLVCWMSSWRAVVKSLILLRPSCWEVTQRCSRR